LPIMIRGFASISCMSGFYPVIARMQEVFQSGLAVENKS
jgi:hypothetical protein